MYANEAVHAKTSFRDTTGLTSFACLPGTTVSASNEIAQTTPASLFVGLSDKIRSACPKGAGSVPRRQIVKVTLQPPGAVEWFNSSTLYPQVCNIDFVITLQLSARIAILTDG